MLEQVEQVVDVAQALRHLDAFAVDDPAVVHPVVGERLAQCHGLGALVLVVRELQVLTAAVQVEILAQQVEAHDHALAVPSGTPVAPRRRPRRLARLGQLPQDEVGRVTLVVGAEHLAVAATDEHVVEVLVDEQAVVGHRLHAEVHTIVGEVRRTAGDQLFDHRDHLRHVLGGVRDVGGSVDVDLAHRLEPHRLALRVISCHGRCSWLARLMMASSMSVTLLTRRTSGR